MSIFGNRKAGWLPTKGLVGSVGLGLALIVMLINSLTNK
jgi:hypothetical protein